MRIYRYAACANERPYSKAWLITGSKSQSRAWLRLEPVTEFLKRVGISSACRRQYMIIVRNYSPAIGTIELEVWKLNLASFKDSASLKDKVYDTLKMEIILGRLKAGDTLNMLELSNLMNVSSVPIREALNMLTKDGFVVLPPYRKATVSEVSVKDYPVVMELRLMLEPYAAKMSVGHIPRERFDQLRTQFKRVLEKPDNVYEYVASDLSLHRTMHQYAGITVLSDVLTTIKEHSLRIHYSMENQLEKDRESNIAEKSTEEHVKILDALEFGTPNEVYQRVRDHLNIYVDRTKFGQDGILDSYMKGRD